jgi:CelD/BcsL family acetyltransferase involved in cellulose biosynthesis
VSLHTLDPLSDRRWDDLVARHPRASAFHQRGWLAALARTYDYETFVLTSAPEGKPLSDGVVFCRVSSWITGTRLVSLPFTDHCQPLLNDPDESADFVDWLRTECDRQQWRYVELRPLSPVPDACAGLQKSCSYCFHQLDLRPSLEEIFRGLHKDSIQRKIQRAEREGLSYEVGRSEQLSDEFYRLQLITRRRHRLLPQPRAWFRNLVKYMGDGVEIRLVRKDGAPVAAMLTLRHRSSVVYKYGCSNEKFHNLGGMPFLFWRLIEESKKSGVNEIDFGRSDVDHEGLITFKDKFNTSKHLLTYYRYTNPKKEKVARPRDWQGVRHLFSILPSAVSSAAGSIGYKHLG